MTDNIYLKEISMGYAPMGNKEIKYQSDRLNINKSYQIFKNLSDRYLLAGFFTLHFSHSTLSFTSHQQKVREEKCFLTLIY